MLWLDSRNFQFKSKKKIIIIQKCRCSFHSSTLLFRSMYYLLCVVLCMCLCVNVYCTTATNPSDRSTTVGSTQPLTEVSTRNISWGKDGRCVRLTTYHHPVPSARNLGTLTFWKLLGPSGDCFTFHYCHRVATQLQLTNITCHIICKMNK